MPSLNRKLPRLATFIAAALILINGCTTSLPNNTRSGDRLVVGTTANYPPVVYRDKNAIVGIEADFAAELGKELNKPIKMIDMPWGQLADALTTGKVDIVMAGVSITEDRKRIAAFTRPYLEVGQMTLIRVAELGRLGAQRDIKHPGRRIGVENNTTGHRFVTQAYPEAEVITFSSAEDAVTALRAGEIDYVIHDAPTVWTLTLGAEARGQKDLLALYYPLTREQLAWAVRKDDPTLLQAVDAALAKMQHDGRAHRIINKWITASAKVEPPTRPVEF